MLGHEPTIFKGPWPAYDPKAVEVEEVEIVLQVNGKVRSRMLAPAAASDEELKRSAARLEFIAPARIVSKQMVANDPKKYSATAVEERAQYNCAGNLTGAPTRFAEPNCRLARFFKSEITGKWGQSEVMLSFGLDDKLLKNAELLAAWDEYSVARAQLKEIVRNYNNLDQVDRQARYALVNKILSASEPGKRVLSFFDGFRQGTMENVSKLLAAATGPQK